MFPVLDSLFLTPNFPVSAPLCVLCIKISIRIFSWMQFFLSQGHRVGNPVLWDGNPSGYGKGILKCGGMHAMLPLVSENSPHNKLSLPISCFFVSFVASSYFLLPLGVSHEKHPSSVSLSLTLLLYPSILCSLFRLCRFSILIRKIVLHVLFLKKTRSINE